MKGGQEDNMDVLLQTTETHRVRSPEQVLRPSGSKLHGEQSLKTTSKTDRLIDQNSRADPGSAEKVALPKLKHVAQAIDKYLQSVQRDLKIQVHKETGDIIVKVISRQDGRVIREIPPEALLNLANKMEELTGILFDENV
jgi:flagellar protein FlaG